MLAAAVLLAAPVLAAAPPRIAGVEAVAVDVALDPAGRRFSGVETLSLRGPAGGADAVALDAAGLSVAGPRAKDGAPGVWELGRELAFGATAQVRLGFSGGADAGLRFEPDCVYSRGDDEGGGRWF